MKKLAILTIAVILVASAILASCAAPTTPAPAPAPTPAPAPAPGQEPTRITPRTQAPTPAPAPAPEPDKVYKLRYSDWAPSTLSISVITKEMHDVMEERAGGRLEIEEYWAQSLLKRLDQVRGIASGLADMGIYVLGANPGAHQINRVMDLPGNAIPSQRASAEIYQKLRDKYPELDKEYGDTFPLMMRGLPAEHIHTTEKFHLVRVPGQAAGLKTYGNALFAEQMNSIGVAIINLGAMEWYTALDRNLIQGMLIHWNAMFGLRLNEVTKYHAEIGAGGLDMQTIGIIMNRESLAKLPADIQKIILDTAAEYNEINLVEDLKIEEIGRNEAIEMGHTVIRVTDEEAQMWYNLLEPVREEWVKDSEAAGFANARAILEDLDRMVAEYK